MECGLGGETRIVEKFKLTPTCRGIDLLSLIFHIEGSKFQKTSFSYYCTMKLHVSDCALAPLGSEATTFQ